MLLAGIFPVKQTQQKVTECSKKKKKSQIHNICVPGIMGTHNILQLFFMASIIPANEPSEELCNVQNFYLP